MARLFRFSGLVALALTGVGPAEAADLVLDAAGPYVAASINGVPLRLKVELDHEDGIALNSAAASRAGLGRGNGKWIVLIGPVKLRGRSAETSVEIAGQLVPTTARWVERDSAADADGVIGPALLPFDRVTLQGRRQGGAEREVIFATKIDKSNGIHVPVRVGRRRVAVRFSLARARTVAPAAAGAVIAAELGGSIEEGRGEQLVSHGVMRPVRPLVLDQPLRVGELAVPSLMVRTADWRGDHDLPWAQPGPTGEIVVTGNPPSQHALYRMTIGADVLKECSAATYIRRTGSLVFRCPGG